MGNNVFYKLSGKERTKLNEVMEITMTDYEADKLYIPIDNLMSALEDLLCEYHHKEEELEDLKRDVDENYEAKNFDPYKEYGVSEHDFH